MSGPVTSTAARPARRSRPQAVLTVREVHRPAPVMTRVVLGGPGFAEFTDNEFTDKYVKIRFVDADEHPVTRTYTVRRVQPELQQLTIDFVVHGDTGLAGPWAAATRPGDQLSLSGAGGAYAPDPAVRWHLFAGDESALPAIGSAVEALPPDARGIAYLESASDELLDDVAVPAGLQVHWLRRPEPGTTPDALAAAIDAGDWPDGPVGVFAHGERESMKAVRAALKRRDLLGGPLSISGYWAHGRTEDRFQAEKREPIGQIG